MIFFGIVFSFFYFFLDITSKKIFALPTSLFVILYSLSFDLRQWDDIAQISFVYDTPAFDFRTYLLFFITLCSFLYAIVFLRYIHVNHNVNRKYNLKRLKYLYYLFTFFSLIAFAINISRVGSLQLLFISPRAYEELFGANTIINYLYFLNVPALCLYVYISHFGEKLKYSIVINIFLFLISFFHGIKFTIFDTIMYPMCLYYILQKRASFKLLLGGGISLLVIFVLFSVFVRGGESKSPLLSILSYILPNFYNLAYQIEQNPSNFGDFFLPFWPDKIPSPTKILTFGDSFNGQFILNPSYNMFTSLTHLFLGFNLLGPFVYIVIFGIQYICFLKRERSILYSFLSTYFLFCLFLTFYFYAYTKFKYVYYVSLFVFIDYWAGISTCLIKPSSKKE